MVSKLAERTSESLNIIDIEGYSQDLVKHETDIMEILQEMIDTEIISVKDISSEIKLMLLLFNLGVQRAEKNKVKKKQELLGSAAPL